MNRIEVSDIKLYKRKPSAINSRITHLKCVNIQNKRVRIVEKIKTVLFGVGAIGSLTAKHLLQKKGIEIVGAIDMSTEKKGRDLGEALNAASLGVAVSNNVDRVLSESKPHVVVHATSSFLRDVYPQLVKIVEHGANVVSTCEELSYPYWSEPELSEKLDSLAKKHGVTVLGTGVNPGFVMDTLVITLTAVCQRIEAIMVTRVMNAATRRASFQKKIGAGLTLEEFNNAIETQLITGHVGLEQSISMIAASLAWKLEKIEVGRPEPLLASKPVDSGFVQIEAGQVAGSRQEAAGVRRGEKAIVLSFKAYVGAEKEYDSISIKGVPNVNQKITPCVHGDQATVAMVVNAIPRVVRAPPGLTTMKDMQVPSATSENMLSFVN